MDPDDREKYSQKMTEQININNTSSICTNAKAVILCDFDSTAASADVIAYIYNHFTGVECNEYRRKWREGLITSPEKMNACFATITASAEEILTSLKWVELDPGFVDLVDWAKQEGIEFAILSDGLDWYIREILENWGVSGITIYSNHIEFTAEGIHLSYPWFDAHFPGNGTSKGTVIQKYRDQGIKTIFIGDGISDYEGSRVADRVYAKLSLLDFCRKNDIEAVEYTTLKDVLADLKNHHIG
jgi:2-hydroxy-3-keto-5-methylthiopentenyl-1-phosphate phosphatase